MSKLNRRKPGPGYAAGVKEIAKAIHVSWTMVCSGWVTGGTMPRRNYTLWLDTGLFDQNQENRECFHCWWRALCRFCWYVHEAQAFIELGGSCSTCAQMAVGRRIGNWERLLHTDPLCRGKKRAEKSAILWRFSSTYCIEDHSWNTVTSVWGYMCLVVQANGRLPPLEVRNECLCWQVGVD